MRLTPLFIFIMLGLLMAWALLGRSPERDDTTANVAELNIPSLDGKKMWSTQTTDGHVTVVNFFASWCGPCAAEMSELVALKKQFPKVQFAGIVWADKAQSIHPFLKKYGNPFDSLWLDKDGDAAMALGIKGIPETFVLDAEGKVRLRINGLITPDMAKGDLSQLITTLIAEKPRAK